MKVSVNFTIDINAEAWALDYGLEPSQVRADVKEHVASIANDWANSCGYLTKGY